MRLMQNWSWELSGGAVKTGQTSKWGSQEKKSASDGEGKTKIRKK
jgi:hypothetical protein